MGFHRQIAPRTGSVGASVPSPAANIKHTHRFLIASIGEVQAIPKMFSEVVILFLPPNGDDQGYWVTSKQDLPFIWEGVRLRHLNLQEGNQS